MISKISSTMYSKLTRSMKLSEAQYTAGLYGMNGAIYTTLSTLILILFGSLLGELRSTCVIIAVYYLNQTVGGGFHATTHTKCLMTMLLGLTIGIGILKHFVWSIMADIALLSAEFVLMWFVPLVLHKNKRFLQTQSPKLIRKSRICLISEILLLFILIVYENELLSAFVVGFTLATLSRVAGKIINWRNN